MKKYWWIILIVVLVIGGRWAWKNRYKWGLVKNITASKMPDSFVRNDGQGTVTWEKRDGEYWYTLDYGIASGVPQKSSFESFMKAYKS